MTRLRTNRMIAAIAGAVAVLAVVVLIASAYTVRPDEYAVVLQFGNPKVTRSEPGLYFRIPFLQEVRRLPKRVQSLIRGSARRSITSDKKRIYAEPWARWRITDPDQFLRVVKTMANAQSKLNNFVDSSLGEVIASHRLIDVVRTTREPLGEAPEKEALRKLQGDDVDAADTQAETFSTQEPEEITIGLEKLVAEIKATVAEKISNPAAQSGDSDKTIDYGFELVDLGLMRVIFVDEVLESVYARMVAERQRWVSAYRQNGEKLKKQIVANAERKAKAIVAEGEQQAAIIRGEADAKATELYATSIEKAKEFYMFQRTLEAYKASLVGKTELIFTTDSAFFKLLNDPNADGAPRKP